MTLYFHSDRQERNFVLLLLVAVHVKSSTYFISPSPTNSWCSATSRCFSLSEVAINTSDFNVSLILMPGNHSLVTNLTITRLVQFSMSLSKDILIPAVINCNPSSSLHLHSITHVKIHSITFNGCLENEVDTVEEFTIQDSTFTAKSIPQLYGRALVVRRSTVIILQSSFTYFQTSLNGGAVYCSYSDVLISSSIFKENRAQKGGVIYCLDSAVLMVNSTVTKNSASDGGALYIHRNSSEITTSRIILQAHMTLLWNYSSEAILTSTSNSSALLIIGSTFTKNDASMGGAIYCNGGTITVTNSNLNYNRAKSGGVLHMHTCILHLNGSKFTFNRGNDGGVFNVHSSRAMIHDSRFENSVADRIGGVGYIFGSTIVITKSVFFRNQARRHAGALYLFRFTKVAINSGRFHDNTAQIVGGSLFLHHQSSMLMTGNIIFKRNSAKYSAVINAYGSELNCNGSLSINNNNGSIALAHSRGYITGNITFIDNKGSLYFFDSEVTISGILNSTKHNRFIRKESDYTLEGGCITLFISRVTISGMVTLNDSTSTNGGGMLAITSRIVLTKAGMLNVINNTATDTGGGIYLFHSEMYVRGSIYILGNRAEGFGGGIHSISSTIVIILIRDVSYIKLENNIARSGGAICLEASSKFYIKQLSGPKYRPAVQCIANTASYGGAIYVADNTTSGTCASSKTQSVTAASQSERFVQILRAITDTGRYPSIDKYFSFTHNSAKSYGAILYGGLLDRCTVNAFGRNIRYSSILRSTDMILNGTTSDPVRVCLCELLKGTSPKLSCSYHPIKRVMKGSTFSLSVAAIDQVNRMVNATIHSSLASRRGHLGEGQQAQIIGARCTNLNFSITTPVKDGDHLVLYAEGPCSDLGISSLKLDVRFIPCYCPTGFEHVTRIKDRCVCGCHHILRSIFPFLRDSDCNPETLLLERNKDFWITTLTVSLTTTTFLTYEQCPSDYCHPSTSSVHIDLNTSNGADVQCTSNRTGVLCGNCQSDFTLSLGSSRCIECPHLWPAIFTTITVVSFLCGLGLVALILVLNLTVAMGTLNGMIFYANVFAANSQLFMPFEHPNVCSVFIAWLNLEIGIDVCFFKGLNAYAKAWLQLTFPVYIILIVVAVIVASQYSRKFANLIAKKNPVATLATLILLSYAKLLHNIIGILSFVILRYTPVDGGTPFTTVGWLRDASVIYLEGKHIPLFIVASLILLLGFIYTFLLLSWQWLVRFPNKRVFPWVSSTKLSSFMDAYHAPYTARNRYWTGLLLLARITLHLTSAINISGEPSVNLLAVSLVIGCLLLLHAYSGINIYKIWMLNVIEFSSYFNILAFTAAKFYVLLVNGDHATIAYLSISFQIVIFSCSLIYHMFAECHITDKIKHSRWYKTCFSGDLRAPLLDNEVQSTAPCQAVTFSEVTIKKSEIPEPYPIREREITFSFNYS